MLTPQSSTDEAGSPAESPALESSVLRDPERIDALVFDVDDTLYLQADWLAGAWTAVSAVAAAEYGVDAAALEAALLRVAAEGSDRGGIIDRGLAEVGASEVPVRPLVDVFLAHAPTELPLLPGVAEMLAELRAAGIGTALVTDGALSTQNSKLAALDLPGRVDHVVLSDELGRQFRKPHPRPVLEALSRLGAAPENVVMIGDRPDKDVAAAAGAGVRAVRVRTGEYGSKPDHPFTWRTAPTAVDAVADLRAAGLFAG